MKEDGNDREQATPSDFGPLQALVWMLGAFSVLVTLALVLILSFPESKNDLVALGLVSALAFVIVSALLISRYPAGPRLSQAIGLRRTSLPILLLALLVGICAQFPADLLQGAVDQVWPSSPAEVTARNQLLEADTWVQALALALVIATLVPFTEEVFFRGAIYGALRRGRSSEVQAAWVAGVGFTLCHFNARLLLPLALVAAVLGTMRVISGSLWPAIMGHIGFNSVAVLGTTGEASFLEASSLASKSLTSVLLLGLLLSFVRLVGAREENRKYRIEDGLVALPGETKTDGWGG